MPTFAMKSKASEIVIRDLDCVNVQPEVVIEEDAGVDKEMEDEIL